VSLLVKFSLSLKVIMTTELSNIMIVLLLVAVIVLLIFYILLIRKYNRLRGEELRHRELFKRMNNEQMDHVYRNRLNPHLLKNSLNGILSHAYQTYYTMDKLAMVLDYVLYESETELVSPKAEIEF